MQFELITAGDGTQSITVYISERDFAKTANSGQSIFKRLKRTVFEMDAIQDGNGVPARELDEIELDTLVDMFHVEKSLSREFKRLNERYTIKDGVLFKDGDPLPENDPLGNQVIRFVDQGVLDWAPLLRFQDKLDANPNEYSRAQFYEFLQRNPFTITEDGDVVAYKGVDRRRIGDDIQDYPYQSTRQGPDTIVDDEVQPSGFIKQALGSVVEHPRSLVHFDPDKACSNGLHVGTFRFASGYGSMRLRVLINPRDVVNVPNYENKVRVCRYVVLDEATADEYNEALLVQQRNVTEGGLPSVELAPGETPHEIVGNIDPQYGEAPEFDEDYCYGCEYSHGAGEGCDDDDEVYDFEPMTDLGPQDPHNQVPDFSNPDVKLHYEVEVTKPARKRYPSPAKFDDAVKAAKRRKKGVKGLIAIADREGWRMDGEDPYDRKAWTALTKAEREAL